MTENLPPMRIGHDERNAAIKCLDEHLSAGRLDPDEYGERMAAASLARSRDELEKLFVDLPEPHPFPSHPMYGPASWRPPVSSTYPVPARRQSSFGATVAALVAVIPFIAVALFLVTKLWPVLLIVPIAGALFGGRGRRRRCGSRFSSGWRGRY